MKKKALTAAILSAMVMGTSSVTMAAENMFSDVPRDHWAYDAVNKLAEDGIITGYADTNFVGDKPITRYEMAQLVSLAMENQENARSVDKAAIKKLQEEFASELAGDVQALKKDVADLKARMGWYGDARVRYFTNKDMKSVDREGAPWHGGTGKASQFEKRVRLGYWAQIDEHFSAEGRMKYEDATDSYGAWDHDKGTPNFNSWDNSYRNQNSFRLDRAFLKYNNKNITASIGRNEVSLGNGLLWWENPIDGVQVDYKVNDKVSAKLGYGDISAEGWHNNNMWTAYGNVGVQTSPATKIDLSFMHTNSDLHQYGSSSSVVQGENVEVPIWIDGTQHNVWIPSYQLQTTNTDDKKDYRLNQIALGINTQLAPKWNLIVEGVRNNVSSSADEKLNKNGVWARLTYGNLVWNQAKTWKVYAEYFALGNASVDSRFWGHRLNIAGGNSNWGDGNYWGDGARGWGLAADYQIARNTNIEVAGYWLKPYDTNAAGFDKYKTVFFSALTYSF